MILKYKKINFFLKKHNTTEKNTHEAIWIHSTDK
jgi:hypothetical protein